MRVLLMPIGSSGDIYPYVRLGTELRNRGHQVTLAANEVFSSLANTADFGFVPLGSREDYERVVADPAIWDKRRGGVTFVRSLILPFMRPQYEAIEQCL